jgi:hypothetical protein
MKKTFLIILSFLFLLSATQAWATNASKTPAPGTIPISRSDNSLDPGWITATGKTQSGIYYCKTETDFIAAIADTAYPLIQITGSFTLTADRTVPAQQPLWMPDSYAITLGGHTLTVNGYFPRPGRRQYFAGTGTLIFGPFALDCTADPAWVSGGININKAVANVIVDLVENEAAPPVSSLAGVNGTYRTANTSATTITDFVNGVIGQKFSLIVNDALTSIQLGSHIKGLQGATGVIPLSLGDLLEVGYGGVSTDYCTGSAAPESCCTGSGTGTCSGSDWHVILVSSAGGANLAYRNRLINPEMNIDQRHDGGSQAVTTSCTDASPCYTADRWYATASGANIVGQRTTGAAPWRHYYVLSGAAGNTSFELGQRIESSNISDLAGSTATLSAYISSSNLTSITWTAYYPTAVDNYATVTQIATGTWTITNTLARYSVQIALPSNAGYGVSIVFSGASGLGAGQTVIITGAQLEPGIIATNFEHRPDDAEMLRCQRYCPSFRFTGYGTIGFYAQASSTTQVFFPVSLPTKSRKTPTAVETDMIITLLKHDDSGYGTVGQTYTVGVNSSEWQVTVYASDGSGFTAGEIMYRPTLLSGTYLYFTGCEL